MRVRREPAVRLGGQDVGATAESAAEQSRAGKLGFKPGQMVQEFGYDGDVDLDLRTQIEDVTGHELVDEDNQDVVVDAVIFWWREEDGDLVDALMDSLTNLAEGGVIWLFTPKAGRDGHVEPSEIEEAAPTAGLHATSTVSACADWTGTRLATPRGGRR
ncbi:MAG: DUF3052 domain-containing protein [Kineosporiaceae bacterium]|nr:DUF3052 domain-containing protein [Kineosporiaceae bacterium]MBK7624395.1 DUF3052 domain-containing protein [Kineosporiaceae bacterium]MBK8077762.1 DUF3052 domain-containing protein [Kineosporiaceae bacterium]